VLSTQCIYVFLMDVRKNSNCFIVQDLVIGFYKWYGDCLLRGTKWVFKENILCFVLKGLNVKTRLMISLCGLHVSVCPPTSTFEPVHQFSLNLIPLVGTQSHMLSFPTFNNKVNAVTCDRVTDLTLRYRNYVWLLLLENMQLCNNIFFVLCKSGD
jgi:hypothetical protein